MNDSPALWIAIIGAVSGLLSFAWRMSDLRQRKRTGEATSLEIIERLSQKKLAEVEAELERLHQENKQLSERVGVLEGLVGELKREKRQRNAGIEMLLLQLQAKGIKPAWMPEGAAA